MAYCPKIGVQLNLWAGRFDRNLENLDGLFDIQDEIVIQIAAEMHVNLTYGEVSRRVIREINNIDSMRMIGKANVAFQTWSREGNFEADRLYSAVLDKHPDSVTILTHLGWVNWQKVQIGISKNPKDDLAKARAFAEKAFAIDELYPFVQTLLAGLEMFAGNHDAAVAHVDRLIELDPNGFYPSGGWVKLHSGQPMESVAYMRRMIRRQPTHFEWVPAILAHSLIRLGQYGEAKQIFGEILASQTKDKITRPAALRGLATIAVFEGDMKRARRFINDWLRIEPSANILGYKRALFFERDRSFLARYLDALRQAGLPENPPTAKPEKPSIAVLPFDNLSDDKEQEYFADGMTDDLITDLSKVSGLIVIARNSVFTYKGKAVKVQKVAKDLNVSHVIEGSVRREGDLVRINAQLIDAETGTHLWADRFDRPYMDIFALQDEVTANIVAALKIKLTSVEQTKLARKPTESVRAYDTYLRARRSHLQDDLMGSGSKEALRLYQEAINLDPTFADAYAYDSWVAIFVWANSLNWILPSRTARDRAEQSIARALKLDSDNPVALDAESALQMNDGMHKVALETAVRAVSSWPNNAFALTWFGFAMTLAGNGEEGLSQIRKARRLDPKPDAHDTWRTAFVYFENRKYEEAAAIFREYVAAAPKSIGGMGLAASYAELGRLDEATAVLDAIFRIYAPFNVQHAIVNSRHWQKDVSMHWIDALRKAGVPEWPHGFKGVETDRLSGEDIGSLIFDRRLAGKSEDWGEFEAEFSKDGPWTFRLTQFSLTGDAVIEGNSLCQTSADLVRGCKHCNRFYRNPGGTRDTRNEYFWQNLYGNFHFSVVE